MMNHRPSGTRVVRSYVPVLALALLTSACGGGEGSRRYEVMQERYAAIAAPPEQLEDEEVGLDPAAPLDRDTLVAAVLARNPNLEAARLAWKSALEEYPQVTALPDPSLSYSIAPGTIISSETHLGQSVQLNQRFPPPRTLSLQGAAALADAEAEMHEWEAARLEMALMASILYDDLFVVTRALAINEDFAMLVEGVRESALARYTVGEAAQKDPLEAELELSHLAHERVVLNTRRATIVAALNRLLHRPPDAALPPVPEELAVPEPLETTADALQALALKQRAELEAENSRIEAARVRVELAEQQYWPGFGVMGQYNSMWQMLEHQFMVGVEVDLPIWQSTRDSQLDRAQADLRRLGHLRQAEVADIRSQVETARLAYVEALHVVMLYRQRVIPIAEQLVESATAGYQTGANDFSSVLEARRALRNAALSHHTAIATAHQARARLMRSTGELPAP